MDIRLAWVDPVPAWLDQIKARPGRLYLDSSAQERGIERSPQSQRGALFYTNREHLVALPDGGTCAVPVWRYVRPDLPHKRICTSTCNLCGVGPYWDLDCYVEPEKGHGLGLPDNPKVLRSDIAMMFALGMKPGQFKVYLTPHARFVLGGFGSPLPRATARLMSARITDDGEYRLLIKFRSGRSMVVTPDEVELKVVDSEHTDDGGVSVQP